ncbi:HAD-IA family hydrolase [candidate division KSB1 bacterium]|nr:HAD-IA family hydrolase [candidate division KSB1 bacterium]
MAYSILFDMDGVLVDTEPVINKAAILTLEEYGVRAEKDDFTAFIGTGETRYLSGVAEKYGLAYHPQMKDRLYEIYLEIVNDLLKPQPGALQCLQTLKEKEYPLALASSADRIKIDANLRVAAIDPAYFRAILSADDVTHKKPHPEIYLTAAERISALPAHCLVIEDALTGVRAAKRAGMRCIAITTSFTKEQLADEHPDRICANFSEVCQEIQTLSMQR